MNRDEELLDLIKSHWPDIRSLFDDEQRELLVTRLAGLADAPDDNRAVRRALQGVKQALFALPPGHPVHSALGGTRLAGAGSSASLPQRARELHAWLTDPGPPADTAAILAAVRQRLLAEPSFSAEEVDDSGADGLIHLTDPARGLRYPAFQFTDDGRPIPVVREVNHLLMADEDPWGAADWWLSGNLWLGGPPAALLGRLPDDLLVGAAAAMREGD